MLITPQRPIVPSPPLCWCGRGWQAHQPWARGQSSTGEEPPDHQYVPAGGTESEAFDAW